MKKIISFEKKLDFPSMIGEVTAISLDHNLKFINECNVEGEFIISGNYKLTEASRLEEQFDFRVTADIVLGEKLDLSTAKIEIDDFYYEIENDDTMICYIDVRIEGVEQIEVEEDSEQEEGEIQRIEPVELESIEIDQIEINDAKIEKILEESDDRIEEDVRECDGDLDSLEEVEEVKREEIEMENNQMMEDEQMVTKGETMGSLFSSLKDSEETFSTYSVYILRQEETVQSLIEKYKTTREDLENYNDLSNLTIGAKIIIPLTNND